MPEIMLSETQQESLRRLMSLEPAPALLPPETVVEIVALLIPPDSLEIDGSDTADDVIDHVVQLATDRRSRTVSDHDLAMLRMICPALQRLVRSSPTTTDLSVPLTATERRVLQLVATGRSNAEIAAALYVSVATVRKHLENAYRKLGVHSRMAAVVACGGGPRTRDDDEPDQKYA